MQLFTVSNIGKENANVGNGLVKQAGLTLLKQGEDILCEVNPS
ncbi:MAG: hypothetical protein AAFV53_36280 [Myxococcota bacterium]